MLHLLRSSFLAPLLGICLFGCSPQVETGVQEVLPLMILPHGEEIVLEVADTPDKRRDGLMFRTSLDQDTGMLFVFSEEAPRSFWMKNTLIPLDVMYLSRDFSLVDYQTMEPCGDQPICPSYPSSASSQYAVEMNAGSVSRYDLKIGDQIQFQNLPQL